MVLNVYYYYFNLNIFFLIFFLIFLFNINIFYINWYDIYSRIWKNEFYVNIYYYWWTSFWYILIFIVIIIFFKIFREYYNYWLFFYLFMLLTIYYLLFFLQIYWLFNINSFFIFVQLENVNILLINSINKYHPYLLYWGGLFIFFYQYFFIHKFFWQKYFFNNIMITYLFFYKFIELFCILFITLGLGGWWAMQEGSWGGWWNWDSSEVFGLLLLFFILFNIHYSTYKITEVYKYWFILTFILIILIVYYFIQFNFNLISHNFDLKINDLINNLNQYLVLILFLLLSILIYWYILWLKITHSILANNKIKHSNKVIYNFFLIFIIITLLLLLYEIIYSFMPLWNDFIWKLIFINISNQIIVFSKYNLSFIIILLLIIWDISIFYIIIIFLNYFNYFNYLFVISFYYNKRFFLLHIFILIFMWLNIISSNYILYNWGLNLSYYNYIYSYNNIFISLDNIILNYTYLYYKQDYIYLFWNIIYKDTFIELITFGFFLLNDWVNQILFLGNKYFFFNINIIDYTALNFLIIISLYIYIVYYYNYKYIIIIF